MMLDSTDETLMQTAQRRKPIDLNLSAAKELLSPQTGYIHYNYDTREKGDTIPLFENFCYVLALFRSRLADPIQDGKVLLEKLLAFEVDGNFPVYLHEYPLCKDRDFSLEILPVFHWLVKDFRAVLTEPLALRLDTAIGRILSHAYKMDRQRPLGKPSAFRLKSYCEKSALPDWTPSLPEEWSHALISCQISDSSSMIQRALERWHPELCFFIGPQNQERGEPQPTLLDLQMGAHYGLYSRRCQENRSIHLQASLVYPFEGETSKAMTSPCAALSPEQPFVLYWGTPEKLNSLFLAIKNARCTGDQTALEITLPAERLPEGQDGIELSFFLNLAPSQQILINGVKATTFQCGDTLEIQQDGLTLRLKMILEGGEGRFFGHILRANRPNQRGKNLKYETYDWQIALRTICRSEDCRLRVEINS